MNDPLHPIAVQHQRHDSPAGCWELAAGAPPPVLAGVVEAFWSVDGWTAHAREHLLPRPGIELIFGLGPVQRLLDPGDPARGTDFRGAWVSGLQQGTLLVEAPSGSRNLGVSLTPAGAHAVLGLPMERLTDRVVDLSHLLGDGETSRLRQRLLDAPGAAARFGLLARWLAARAERGPRPDAGVAWAVERLGRPGGARVGDLGRELGWSARRLADRFRLQVGLTPKRYARLVRFCGLIERLRTGSAVDWAELALGAGYYDQAHLIRDFKAFSGVTPGEFLVRHSPDLGGVVDGG